MTDQALSPMAPGPNLPLAHGVNSLISNGASAIGEPLYLNAAGQASPALASGASGLITGRCIGLAAFPIPNGAYGLVQYKGVLEATTAQWDAVVTGESGGLTPGTSYWVSDVNPGKLVTAAPVTSGHIACLVGTALSSTQMMILIGQPINAQDE